MRLVYMEGGQWAWGSSCLQSTSWVFQADCELLIETPERTSGGRGGARHPYTVHACTCPMLSIWTDDPLWSCDEASSESWVSRLFSNPIRQNRQKPLGFAWESWWRMKWSPGLTCLGPLGSEFLEVQSRWFYHRPEGHEPTSPPSTLRGESLSRQVWAPTLPVGMVF